MQNFSIMVWEKIINITASILVSIGVFVPQVVSISNNVIINQNPSPVVNSKVIENQVLTPKENTQYVVPTYKPYIPIPIQLRPTEYGGFVDHLSPDKRFVARSYSDEGGDSGVYITDSNGKKLTETYCGFFNEWSKDNTKIKVLVPAECGIGYDYEYFYLDVNGKVTTIPK